MIGPLACVLAGAHRLDAAPAPRSPRSSHPASDEPPERCANAARAPHPRPTNRRCRTGPDGSTEDAFSTSSPPDAVTIGSIGRPPTTFSHMCGAENTPRDARGTYGVHGSHSGLAQGEKARQAAGRAKGRFWAVSAEMACCRPMFGTGVGRMTARCCMLRVECATPLRHDFEATASHDRHFRADPSSPQRTVFALPGHDRPSRKDRRAQQPARASRPLRAPCAPPTRHPLRQRTRRRSQVDGLTRPRGHPRAMRRDRGLCAPFPPPTIGRAPHRVAPARGRARRASAACARNA